MKNLKMPVYLKALSKKEILFNLLKCELLVAILGVFFYRSIAAIVIISPLSLIFLIFTAKDLYKRKQFDILMQFKELLVSVNSSIQAGYSLENAFINADRDMRELYGEGNFIISELEVIKRGLYNNCTLVSLLKGMAVKTNIEEIEDFADIMIVAKHTGGRIKEIMESYISSIEEKTALKEEVKTMISQRSFELKIMNVVPFLILVYVSITSKGFFDMLYGNLFGQIIMSFILAAYLFSIYLSKKIIDISL